MRTSSYPFVAALAAALACAAPAAAAPATVTVDNDAFSPADVTIDAGESVTWNVLEGGHNIDAYEGPETFKSTSGKNTSGTTFARTLAKPGTYRYLCDYHGDMTGTIVVKAVPVATAPAKPAAAVTAPAVTAAPGPHAPAPELGPATTLGTPAAAAPAADAAPPALRKLGFRRNRLRLSLSEQARIVVRYVRVGERGHRVRTRVVRADRGTVALRLDRWMRNGRYRVSVLAFDAGGNMARPVRADVRVRH